MLHFRICFAYELKASLVYGSLFSLSDHVLKSIIIFIQIVSVLSLECYCLHVLIFLDGSVPLKKQYVYIPTNTTLFRSLSLYSKFLN